MRYMIHACPPRMWYVDEFLIPSMKAQGIQDNEITVWNDTEGKGNLFSCMESFRTCGERDGSTWHIQDDVIISRDFAKKTRQYDEGIVCGFGCQNFGPYMQNTGIVPAAFMWYSFQCIRIPNELAGECAEWFNENIANSTQHVIKVAEKKHDDWFFRMFIMERHPKEHVINLKPNLVDHIDYLIGGTLINKQRNIAINRAKYFPDPDLVEDREKKLMI